MPDDAGGNQGDSTRINEDHNTDRSRGLRSGTRAGLGADPAENVGSAFGFALAALTVWTWAVPARRAVSCDAVPGERGPALIVQPRGDGTIRSSSRFLTFITNPGVTA